MGKPKKKGKKTDSRSKKSSEQGATNAAVGEHVGEPELPQVKEKSNDSQAEKNSPRVSRASRRSNAIVSVKEELPDDFAEQTQPNPLLRPSKSATRKVSEVEHVRGKCATRKACEGEPKLSASEAETSPLATSDSKSASCNASASTKENTPKTKAGKSAKETENISEISPVDDAPNKEDNVLKSNSEASVEETPKSRRSASKAKSGAKAKQTDAKKSAIPPESENTSEIVPVDDASKEEDNVLKSKSDASMDETPKSRRSTSKAKSSAKAKQTDAKKSAATPHAAASDDAVFLTPKSRAKKTTQGSAKTQKSDEVTKVSRKKTPKSKEQEASSDVNSAVNSETENSDVPELVTPKSKAKGLVPKTVLTETEFVTPKSKGTPRNKKRSAVSEKSSRAKTKTPDSSENEDKEREVKKKTPARERKKPGMPEHEAMEVDATPETPADQIATETPETGGRSRRSAAIKARRSFQTWSKISIFDDEEEGGKKSSKKASSDYDDDSDADPDAKLEDESSSEESEGEEVDSDDSYEGGTVENRGLKTTRKPDSEMPYSDYSNGQLGATVKAFYKFYMECERSKLFYNWRPKPSHFTQLSDSEKETYLPFHKSSPKYSLGFKKSTDRKKAKESTLGLFESHSREYKMCFTGGPIRAMHWCPVRPKDKSAPQVMAVYSMHHPDFRHTSQQPLQTPSLIQLWNFGKLKETQESAPVMSCGLAVDIGPIHELKWCPFGAYEDAKSVAESDNYPRLGLLAVAACDGFAYIFSIPHLDQVPNSNNSSHPIFRAQPVAKLVPSVSAVKASYGPCMCLDWQWKDSLRIFAGYGNGQIAVFQLDTESLFLHRKLEDGTDLISPFFSFAAHRDVVTAISVCQNVPDYFTSVSHDRCVRVWDLKRPEAILNHQYKFLFNCGLWPPQNPSIMVSLDYGPGNYWLLESGYFGAKGKPMVPHMDSCWHIDYSPWIRAGASVDGDGALAVTFLPNLLVHRIHSGMYRHSCYVVKVKATVDEESEENIQQENVQKENIKQENDPQVVPPQEGHSSKDNNNEEPNSEKEKDSGDVVSELQNPVDGGEKNTEKSGETPMDTSEGASGIPVNASGDAPQDVRIKKEREEVPKKSGRASFAELHDRTHLAYTVDTSKDYRRQKYKHFKLVHDLRILPMQALYRTAWNPNIRWRTWLAFGGQSGILGVLNFNWHDNNVAAKLCKDIR